MRPDLSASRAERLGVLACSLAALAVIAALAALGYSRITGAFEPPPAGLTEPEQARHTLQSAVKIISGVLLLTGVFGVAVLAALWLVASSPHNATHSIHIAMKLSVLAVLIGLLVLPITQIHGGPAMGPAYSTPASSSESATVHVGDRQ